MIPKQLTSYRVSQMDFDFSSTYPPYPPQLVPGTIRMGTSEVNQRSER